MGALLAGIAALAAPMVARVMIAFGLSAVTLTGIAASISALRTEVFTRLGDVPAASLQLCGLAGVWVGLGYWLGAITFTVTLWGLTKAVRITKG